MHVSRLGTIRSIRTIRPTELLQLLRYTGKGARLLFVSWRGSEGLAQVDRSDQVSSAVHKGYYGFARQTQNSAQVASTKLSSHLSRFVCLHLGILMVHISLLHIPKGCDSHPSQRFSTCFVQLFVNHGIYFLYFIRTHRMVWKHVETFNAI